MQVTSPEGAIVHALKGTSGEKFEFKAPQSGTYKFCFNNPVATPETVSFYIHVGHIPNEYDLAKDGQFNSNFYPSLSLPLSLSLDVCIHFAEHLDPVNVRITELREALLSVAAEQKYLKARDARHRASELP